MESLRRRVERHSRHMLNEIIGLKTKPYRRHLRLYRNALSEIYDKAFEASGQNILIDSSKDPAHLAIALGIPDVRFFVIHLVRDPRAVAFSWLTPKRRREVHWREEHMARIPPLTASMTWNYINFAMERLACRAPDYIRLRYEDLVQDQEPLREFLGRVPVPREPAKQFQTAWHSVSGNPSRFDPGAEIIAEDRRWMTGLKLRDRQLVNLVTAPFRSRYGYQ